MPTRGPYVSTAIEPLVKPKHRKLAILLGALIVILPRVAAAEPVPLLEMPTMHLLLGTGDGKLTGPNGLDYRIPQGSHILAPDSWKEHDDKFKLLQDDKTRLTAENKSLRESADEWPWLPVAIGVGVGLTMGVYLGAKLAE